MSAAKSLVVGILISFAAIGVSAGQYFQFDHQPVHQQVSDASW